MASKDTIRTDVYTAFYNILQTGTYAISTDNIHPHVTDAQWAQNDRGYPIVEIKVSITGKPDKRFTGIFNNVEGETVITVIHNSAEGLKTQSDQIDKVFHTDGALKALSSGGIFVNDVSSELNEPMEYGGKRTRHSETITIEWRWNGR